MGIKRRSKRAKKCSVCEKILGHWNKTGLCTHHYKIQFNRDRRAMFKNKHLCINCGGKVEPIIIYPIDKTAPPITKYGCRCNKCTKKHSKRYKKSRIKEVVTPLK